MTTVIVLTVEDDAPEHVGITVAGLLTVDQAIAILEAASRHFREQAMEQEVLRRLKEREDVGPSEPDSDS